MTRVDNTGIQVMASKTNGNPNACSHVCADEIKGGATIVEKDLSIDSGISLSVERSIRFVRVFTFSVPPLATYMVIE